MTYQPIYTIFYGEIENSLRKQHRNTTRYIKPHVNLGSKHDRILKLYVNASKYEIRYFEIVGKSTNVNIKGCYENLEKLIPIFVHSTSENNCDHCNKKLNNSEILIYNYGYYYECYAILKYKCYYCEKYYKYESYNNLKPFLKWLEKGPNTFSFKERESEEVLVEENETIEKIEINKS
ncbi:hypothetical protein Glove_48g13 [Diversispora epigaea]|uniref:Uncharacterized protein n=1 Tax=Diversispora epigaea TaxID=1348612 RepID=A0A397JQC2_9GLOM|nr:hypothetical protein Glove_48g13 [Diversispora epigaea]